ncbi:MAG TPA: glycosyltransferase [Anaerolineaceae bacterium]|nr:glycosyltransferase [Anaerolineaceae bacterium]
MNFSLLGPVYPYRGGIAQHSTRLSLALATAGHNIQVLSFHKQYPAWLYPGRVDKDPSLSALQIEADALLEPFSITTWMSATSKIIASRPDLVILPYWTPLWAPAFAFLANQLRQKAVPVVFLVHNVLPHERLPFDRTLASICLGKGQAFITHSQREAKRLQNLLGSHIKVFYQPHPLYDHFRRVERSAARQRLGYRPDDFLLLFFGFVRAYKGLDLLIQALGSLGSGDRQPKLLVAGEFWQKPARFYKQIKKLGLDKTVRLDNRYIPQEEIPWLFSAADLFVAPYIDGTQSGAVRLAMSFNLPILATEKAVTPNEQNYAGLKIVPANDAAALAEGIRAWPSACCNVQPGAPNLSNGWGELVNLLEHLAVSARTWQS